MAKLGKVPAPGFLLEAEMVAQYGGLVCGIDEAGRGPWAGPVVAAAVILDHDHVPAGINDSKKLSQGRREVLFDEIQQSAQIGIGIVGIEDIAELNILQATFKAMRKAVDHLSCSPGSALIDGNGKPGLSCPMRTVVKGDQKSLSIAAASIIAKVTRDKIMQNLDRQFPFYGWARNKGYGTVAHRKGLAEYGVSPHHRTSFKPIAALLLAGKSED